MTLISQGSAVYGGRGLYCIFFVTYGSACRLLLPFAVCSMKDILNQLLVSALGAQQCAGTVVLGGPSLTSRQIIDPACQLKGGAFCRNMLAEVTCVVRSGPAVACSVAVLCH